MARVVIKTDAFEDAVEGLIKRATNARVPLRAWGLHMVGSVKRNFQEQGRPVPWRPLKVNTLLRRLTRGKSKSEGGRFAPNPHVFKQGQRGVGALSTVSGFARSRRTGRILRNRSGGLNKIARPGFVFRAAAVRAVQMGKILLDRGTLRKSISSKVMSGQEVQIGTNLEYAGPHQFGSPKQGIVERPFMVIQPDDEEEFVALLTEWVTSGGRFGAA